MITQSVITDICNAMKRDQDGANEWQRELIMQISAHKYNQYIEKEQFKCCERG